MPKGVKGFLKGYTPWNKGVEKPIEQKYEFVKKEEISLYQKNYRKTHKDRQKILHKIWRDKHREELRALSRKNNKENAKYYLEYTRKWRKENPEKRRIYEQKRGSLERGGGKLTIQTVQLVYENNIKKYNRLTCYLCMTPIEFGQDTLEHKIPLSRGGTNEIKNLDIAHKNCNSKKGIKTVEEYLEFKQRYNI